MMGQNESPTPRGRIAIVIPFRYLHDDPSKSSIDFELYVSTLRTLGYDTLIVCLPGSTCSRGIAMVAAPIETFRTVEFWKSLHIGAVFIITWLRFSAELRAIRGAGIRVTSRADSDGAIGVRLFPRIYFGKFVCSQCGFLQKLRMFKHWLHLYLARSRWDELENVASIEASDVVAIETETARQRVFRLLNARGRNDLKKNLIVAPHLIGHHILTQAVQSIHKKRKIVAIGRWDSWQKGAVLLTAALKQLLSDNSDVSVTLIGQGGPAAFSTLSKWPSVVCTGPVSRDDIYKHLLDAQILALSSQWESFHIAAHEALCLGCTVVGPEVIPIPDIMSAGDFGEMVHRRSASRMADALARELDRWRMGTRNAVAIAQFWRGEMDPISVVQTMLGANSIP